MNLGNTTLGGYPCEKCGTWIQDGTLHTCLNNKWQHPHYITYRAPEDQENEVLLRIATALEGIRDALESNGSCKCGRDKKKG